MGVGSAGTLLVIAKEPLPGHVKTRLTPPLRPADAALVAGAALRDTLDVLDGVPATDRVLAFDGDPDGWLRPGWRAVPQPSGGLDRRLAAAFGAVGTAPALLVGMDTPQLRPEQVTAWDPSTHDACLGPAADGGFWAIGLADPRVAAAAILDVPMSTPDTGAAQLARLRALGLSVQLLDELVDVDTVTAACTVAEQAPFSRFAAALRTALAGAAA